MCGIAGLIAAGSRDAAVVHGMAHTLAHRGPDDEGVWIDADARVGLGHRRLSIVDMSPAGHQPMLSSNGRFVLTLNGEIYNHRETRAALEREGAVPEGGWRGHSDTETFIEAIAAWGLATALDRCVGMFAFALWDRNRRTLSLVRDRFGEKPLYYGWAGRDFIFASELKAMRAHPRFAADVDRSALDLFARRGYVRAPLSIYRGIFKVEPGCVLELDGEVVRHPLTEAPRVGSSGGGLSYSRYWSYRGVLQAGMADPIRSESEAVEELERVLAVTVAGQSMADVPVGAFLSGGIDSSTVVALYQKYSSQPVRTFTIGFAESAYDESADAQSVARHFGTRHHQQLVTVREAQDVIPSIPAIYDEPFADSSQIPTYLVSRFAREHVTVALSGDGGDELFGGYRRHFLAPRLWRQLSRVPRPLRATGTPLSLLPSRFWQGAAGLLPRRTPPNAGARIQQALKVAASATSFGDVCASLLDEWNAEGSPVIGGVAPGFDLDAGEGASDAERIMYCDSVSYLPDDILAKVDRAAMSVSLETRVPFLDHRVAEVAARIPAELKFAGSRGKHILRLLLAREAPARLFDRPKAGFAIPIGEWLRGPLRPWAEDLLDAGRMRTDGWFDPKIVQRRWQCHLSGHRESTSALWAILMFQAWYREQSKSYSRGG